MERVIAAMDIDTESIEMQTLGVVKCFDGAISIAPTIGAIHELVRKKSRVSKNWVYKTLSELEAEGYLVTDKIRRPHLYLTSNEMICRALNARRLRAIKAIEDDIKTIDRKIEILETTDLTDFYNLMTHKEDENGLSQDPAIIEGAENVEMSASQAIFAAAQEGDIIRSLTPLRILDKGLVNTGKLELEMAKALARGAIVKSLFIPTTDDLSEIDEASNFFRMKHKEMLEHTRNNRIITRIFPRPHSTYRFITLNSERIAMFMTNVARPELVLISTNKGTPRLIKDALLTWHRLWDQSIDSNEQVAASLEKAV